MVNYYFLLLLLIIVFTNLYIKYKNTSREYFFNNKKKRRQKRKNKEKKRVQESMNQLEDLIKNTRNKTRGRGFKPKTIFFRRFNKKSFHSCYW